MELIGSIANQGTLQGQINDANGYLTGVITNAGLLGGQVVAERGLKGDKGDKGDQGEKGDAFTYDDFTPEQLAGLKGEKGDKGDTGSQGVQGEKGDPFTYDDFTPEQLASLKGAKGDKGDKGDQGIQGIQGVQGIQGEKGEKGEKGDTGSQGIQGEKGDKGDTGAKGDTGEKGDTGAKGDKGDKGDTGDDGYSPSASVSKSGSVATITITDKNGTTTATVSDGSSVPSGGTTGQVLTKDSDMDYDASWEDPSGGTITDVTVDGTSIVDDGVAELETVTQLRDGLMTATDKQKLDGIASGAEVNVNADWEAVSGDAQILNKPTIPSKTSDLINDSGFITGMTILSYGNSTWQNFIDAYNANKVVYCRASSNSNPASGSQTRLAFMAYVNNATTPTEVEFQYYRSIASHTASQQGDQVFVYKLNKTNGWSVTTREAATKILPSTGLQSSYSNGTLTITAPHDTTKQDTLVSGTNIKTINNTSLLGSGDITVSAENEIFICEYGDTTFADALVAYNAGKRLVCHYNDGANDFFVWLVICDSESTYFWFEVTSGDKRMEFCLDQNGWTRGEYPASAIPIARRISKFTSDARMNSTDMTSAEVEDFVDELDVSGGLLGDYVVEQGTSGIWTYRKWNSGIAECWGRHSFTVTAWAQWGSCWESNQTYATYPTSLFTAQPQLSCQHLCCSDGSAVASVEMYQSASSSRTPSMYLTRYTSANANVTGYIDIHAKGTWK